MTFTIQNDIEQVQRDPQSNLDDFELTQRLTSLYVLARDQKRRYQSTWRRNYLLTTNRQYAMNVQQPWTPNVVDSEIFPILSSRVAWMTDQRITPIISPASTAGEQFRSHQEKLSDDLEALLETQYKNQGWDKEVELVLWDAAQFGAGIFKACWDSGLDYGLGNITMKRIDAWTFYPDPNATSLDDCSYMFEVRKMTVEDIERRFPTADVQAIIDAAMYGDRSDESNRPGATSGSVYPMAQPGNLPGSQATVWGLPGQANRSNERVLTEGVNVNEVWLRENRREERERTDFSSPQDSDDEDVVTDEWRCVVYSGNVILFDEYASDLYQYNRHPYSRYVDEEMGEFWPTPIASHLAPCQIAINRLLSSVQGNSELVGNPIFIDVKGSGLQRTQIVNRPGLRMTMDKSVAQNQGTQPHWMEPPKLSGDINNLIQFWISRMENISGLSGVSKGAQPAGRQAQQTVQATQEAGFVRIRSSVRNLERTLGEVFSLLTNLAIQNYDVPRVMAIIGDDGKNTALRFASNHFFIPTKGGGGEPIKYSLQVMAGSSNPTSRQARIAESDALFAMHAIDRQAVLMAHAYPHWQDIEARMEQKEQQQQNIAIAMQSQGPKGQPKGPGTGHEH
jgi:hypothetical protein